MNSREDNVLLHEIDQSNPPTHSMQQPGLKPDTSGAKEGTLTKILTVQLPSCV